MARPRMSVPHHIPDLPRPQEEYNMFINNLNQPFEHVWLQRSEDGTRVIHPLEHLSASDFIDVNVGSIEPIKPLPMENTPFKLVEEVKELKQLAAKLLSVNEFAVDLEHNHYRSFQGITCLMQISTRTEDFVVDTLKLRVHVGPYLREVFKDPSKKKIMHGAECDIVWLQRDFGIYLCNLFDTQQASRVLELERNSLEYLMLYFCGVAVDKSCQKSDWRLRPLPDDMLKYAREDTHYLLYIYDLMRGRLVRDSKGGSDLLLEVYRRSYDVCMRLYEKELLTDTSYLYTYGLHEADFNSQQLSIVAGLFEWRDAVARAEDESTGYILPNRTLLEIARQMPLTVGRLHRLVKAKHPYVEVNLDSVVNIIKSSIRNAAAFESAAHLLKKKRQETGEVEQIKLMNISAFQSFVPSNEQLIPVAANNQKTHDSIAMLSGDTKLGESALVESYLADDSIAMLSGDTKLGESALVESYLADQEPLTADHNDIGQRDDTNREQPKLGAGVDTTSLSILSTRFWKCFQLKHEKDNDVKQIESAFDYAAGMGQNKEESTTTEEGDVGFKSLLHSRDRCNNSVISRFRKDEVTKDFQQAKQYLSFMHAGN